ncbi:peroxisome biogenesis protein 16-like [Carex rostrata]
MQRTNRLNFGSEERDPYSELCQALQLKRRKNILALYILRDPFFTRYTRSRLEKVDQVHSPVPIVSFFTSKLVELLIGIQTCYTYTTGS